MKWGEAGNTMITWLEFSLMDYTVEDYKDSNFFIKYRAARRVICELTGCEIETKITQNLICFQIYNKKRVFYSWIIRNKTHVHWNQYLKIERNDSHIHWRKVFK